MLIQLGHKLSWLTSWELNSLDQFKLEPQDKISMLFLILVHPIFGYHPQPVPHLHANYTTNIMPHPHQPIRPMEQPLIYYTEVEKLPDIGVMIQLISVVLISRMSNSDKLPRRSVFHSLLPNSMVSSEWPTQPSLLIVSPQSSNKVSAKDFSKITLLPSIWLPLQTLQDQSWLLEELIIPITRPNSSIIQSSSRPGGLLMLTRSQLQELQLHWEEVLLILEPQF